MKRDVKRKRYNDIRAFKMTLRSVWIAAMRGYKPCACVGVALYNISSGKTLKRKTKRVFTDIVTALWNSLSRQYRDKENEIRRINHSKHTVWKCKRGWTGGFREDKTKVGQGENREGIKHHVREEKKKKEEPVNENKRAGWVYSPNVCGFSCSAAAGHGAALDAEYFIPL